PEAVHRSSHETVDKNKPAYDDITSDDETPPAETHLRAESPWRDAISGGGSGRLRNLTGRNAP
ncbi:hypothetical protein RJZ56_004698, partial [Blastomyces dermatitidis]